MEFLTLKRLFCSHAWKWIKTESAGYIQTYYVYRPYKTTFKEEHYEQMIAHKECVKCGKKEFERFKKIVDENKDI